MIKESFILIHKSCLLIEMNFQQYSILPLQEVAVRTVSDGYTLYFGWLHPLDVMATPFIAKGVALRKRYFTRKKTGYNSSIYVWGDMQ